MKPGPTPYLTTQEEKKLAEHLVLSAKVGCGNDSALVSNDCLDTPTFTVEQKLKYATSFEEGYDLVDVHYEAWLKINHPESARPGDTHQTLNNPLPSVGTSLPLSHSPSVALNNIPATVQRSPRISSGDAIVSHINLLL